MLSSGFFSFDLPTLTCLRVQRSSVTLRASMMGLIIYSQVKRTDVLTGPYTLRTLGKDQMSHS